jgi:hypothetical protein
LNRTAAAEGRLGEALALALVGGPVACGAALVLSLAAAPSLVVFPAAFFALGLLVGRRRPRDGWAIASLAGAPLGAAYTLFLAVTGEFQNLWPIPYLFTAGASVAAAVGAAAARALRPRGRLLGRESARHAFDL